jgi:predicted  nucleic acid-binding Zn-ribbon protein
MDAEATKLGVFEEYKNFRLFKRAIAQATEARKQIEDGIRELKPHYEQVLEDGRIEIWHLPKPIDEMKADMELEIANIDKGLAELEEDIVIYENKLRELNNPILNRIFDAR